MSRVWLQHEDGAHAVPVELRRGSEERRAIYQAVIGATPVEVEVEGLEAGSGWLRIQGKILPFHAVRKDGRVELWIQGRTYSLALVNRGVRRAIGGPSIDHSGDLTAAMPGTILKVNVRVGDDFEAHAPLIVMESMKMELTLSSPHRGRVAELVCAVGDMVEMGRLLARVERTDDDDDA